MCIRLCRKKFHISCRKNNFCKPFSMIWRVETNTALFRDLDLCLCSDKEQEQEQRSKFLKFCYVDNDFLRSIHKLRCMYHAHGNSLELVGEMQFRLTTRISFTKEMEIVNFSKLIRMLRDWQTSVFDSRCRLDFWASRDKLKIWCVQDVREKSSCNQQNRVDRHGSHNNILSRYHVFEGLHEQYGGFSVLPSLGEKKFQRD